MLMNIAILNLSRDVDSETLEKLFASYGEVDTCDVVLDKKTGTSKGFGFVVMQDEEAANKAILELHGTKVNNQKIRVKAAGFVPE